MALTEQVILDIQSAERQITALEAQLAGLGTPINVPVNVTGEGQLDRITSELGQSEASVASLNSELGQTDDALRDAATAAGRTGDQIETAGRKGTTAFAGLTTSVTSLLGAFAAIGGARAFLDFAQDSIQAASDLEESTSKAQVVFGQFFDEVQSFAGTAPQALGLANQQAIEFAGTFGNLFTALGLSQQAAADLAPEIVQLGADLASFNNIEVTDALDKLRAGLVGEAEPLRALGVNLTAATVEAKALELGLVGVGGELTEAAKVQARYALILEQTATAQGDFARTSDSLANSQRTLNAEWTEAQAAVGQALVPALLGAIPILESFATVIGVVGIELGDLLGTIDPAAAALQRIMVQTGQTEPSAALLATALSQVNDQLERSGQLGFNGIPAAQVFTEQAQALVDAANLTGPEIERLIGGLDSLVDQEVITGEQSEILAGILERELASGIESARADNLLYIASLQDTGDELTNLGDLLRGISPLLALDQGLGASARLFDMAEAAAVARQRIEEIDDSLRGLTVTPPDFSDIEAAFESGLPGALNAAQEALRTEEGEIIADFATFLDELKAELDARVAFQENLELLRALGFDDLATAFEQAGLEAAPALADGITDPAALAEAEAALDQAAVQLAGFTGAKFAEELDLFLTNLDAIEMPVVPVLGPLDISAIRGISVRVPAAVSGAETGVTVNQTFTSPETPAPDRQRAIQSVNGIVAGNLR